MIKVTTVRLSTSCSCVRVSSLPWRSEEVAEVYETI